MKIRYDVISDVGCVRTNNEDMALVFGEQIRDSSASFAFDMPENMRFSAIVADGMGGYEGGEIASAMATRSFDEFLNGLPEGLDQNDVVMELKQWIKNINEEIISAAGGSGMGCTFCGIFTYEEKAFVINVGDSRMYRIRYDLFKQITTDHSERNRKGDMSIPSNIIYNALGVPGAFVDVIPTKMIAGDKYIICSDGLSDMVEDETIAAILKSGGDITRQLVTAALNAGGKDNVTVIYIEIS